MALLGDMNENGGSFGSKFNIQAMLRSLVGANLGILPFAGTPVNGTSGTYVKMAGPGTIVLDYTNGKLYVNSGTKASPVWTLVSAPVSATYGLGMIGNAKATYDFAIDGGAISTITLANGPTIPDKAIILGGTIDITTNLVGATATIAVGTSAGSSTTSLKAATAVASYVAGQLAIVPVFTAATYLKLTAAGRVTITIAVAPLTAGKFDVNLVYIMGN